MRQFLALELPEALRCEVRALQRTLGAEARGWRWLAAEGIHLTLRFLGEVGPELDAPARIAWREAARRATPFEARLSGTGWFPQRGRPRVLWVGVRETIASGRLEKLASSLESGAREVGFEPERRPFRPHLTLARASRGRRATLPETREFLSAATLPVERVVLFRSELLPAGARYTVLESLPLLGR